MGRKFVLKKKHWPQEIMPNKINVTIILEWEK